MLALPLPPLLPLSPTFPPLLLLLPLHAPLPPPGLPPAPPSTRGTMVHTRLGSWGSSASILGGLTG